MRESNKVTGGKLLFILIALSVMMWLTSCVTYRHKQAANPTDWSEANKVLREDYLHNREYYYQRNIQGHTRRIKH